MEVLLGEVGREALPQGLPGPPIIRQPQVAPYDVLEQAQAGLFLEAGAHHGTQDSADRKEALCCGTDVIQAHLHPGHMPLARPRKVNSHLLRRCMSIHCSGHMSGLPTMQSHACSGQSRCSYAFVLNMMPVMLLVQRC